MKKRKKLAIISIAIVVVCVLLDQLLKIWVKSNMEIGETIPLIGQWFNLYFVENPGMAFGLSFGDNLGKLALSLLRLGVVGYLVYFIWNRIRKDEIDTLAVCVLSLIVAGAFGNIIDSALYGLIYGYAPFMYGRVVDMIYVRLFVLPDWFPGFGGSYFFPAIFNFADACVTVGIVLMLCFYKHFFKDEKKSTECVDNKTADAVAPAVSKEDKQ